MQGRRNLMDIEETRFCQITVEDMSKVTQEYTDEVPLIAAVKDAGCGCTMTIPVGFTSIVTRSGEIIGTWGAGFHMRNPFTYVAFLVTQQAVLYDLPVKNIPTADNVYITIDVSIVFKVKEDHESVFKFVYGQSVSDLNELLRDSMLDTIRGHVRSRKLKKVYDIKGEGVRNAILENMNKKFANYGMSFVSVIFTNIVIPWEIFRPWYEKTTYKSKNALERKKQFFELLIKYDEHKLKMVEQTKHNERKAEGKKFEKRQAQIDKEHKQIKAETLKSVSELKEKKEAEVNAITAKSELAGEEIRAETRELTAKLIAQGEAEVQKKRAETEAYINKKEARVQKECAIKRAEAIQYEGKIENEAGKMLVAKREHQARMRQLAVIYNLSKNPKAKIFGNAKEDGITQMAAYRIVHGHGQI